MKLRTLILYIPSCKLKNVYTNSIWSHAMIEFRSRSRTTKLGHLQSQPYLAQFCKTTYRATRSQWSKYGTDNPLQLYQCNLDVTEIWSRRCVLRREFISGQAQWMPWKAGANLCNQHCKIVRNTLEFRWLPSKWQSSSLSSSDSRAVSSASIR